MIWKVAQTSPATGGLCRRPSTCEKLVTKGYQDLLGPTGDCRKVGIGYRCAVLREGATGEVGGRRGGDKVCDEVCDKDLKRREDRRGLEP